MTERFELGAELLGGSHRIRDEMGDKPRPWEYIVQKELTQIAAALHPEVFDAAYRRGAQRGSAESLAFAEQQLRAAIS
jgi:hypothetical protein